MKTLCRVGTIVAVMLLLLVAAAYWGIPIFTSTEVARKASPAARMVPRELDDVSVSDASGKALSYFGYDFQVPWGDLDETRTELYPKEHPSGVVLTFRSGLRLAVSTFPAREFANGVGKEFGLSPERSKAVFGDDDYEFLRHLYDFTPQKMHRWSLSSDVHTRESMLITLKSISLSPWAKDGIFKIQNPAYRGFQQGSSQLRSKGILVNLYGKDGGVQLVFDQKNYDKPAGLTQPEINRIVQSLRKPEKT